MPSHLDSPAPIGPEHTRPVAAAQSNNQERSTLDKVEEIGLLAVHGAWEHIKNDKTSIAVKAVEGIAIGAAIMTAPAWVGVAAGVAGVGLLGKELYDKGKHVLPALEIVWDDKKPQNKLEEYRHQLAKETVSKELGSAIVDSAVMVGSGMAAGRLASALKPGLTVKPKELTEVDHNQIAIDAQKRKRELFFERKAEWEEKLKRGEVRPIPGGYGNHEPQGLMRGLDAIPESVGSRFNGHGMEKYTWMDNLASLKEILTKGIDKNRVFHEMPLRGGERAAGAFGAERPFDTGPFILLGAPGQKIGNSGVKFVLVNDHFYGAIPQLQAAYPHVEFIKARDAAVRLAEILAGKKAGS